MQRGDPVPDVTLSDLDGETVSLASRLDGRCVLFCWAPWCQCRSQLPGWDSWCAQHARTLRVLAVAVDVRGPSAAAPFARSLKRLPVLVDAEGALPALFDTDYVPIGALIDERQRLCYLECGSFDINAPETQGVIQRFVEGADRMFAHPHALEPERERSSNAMVESKVRLARTYIANGRQSDALRELDEALLRQPDNRFLRKQRWAIRHPERFEGAIDRLWQDQQLAAERAAEQDLLAQSNSRPGEAAPRRNDGR